MGGEIGAGRRRRVSRSSISTPREKGGDIVCALASIVCVSLPIKPLMLRCPSSAAVQLWPSLPSQGPRPHWGRGRGPRRGPLVSMMNQTLVSMMNPSLYEESSWNQTSRRSLDSWDCRHGRLVGAVLAGDERARQPVPAPRQQGPQGSVARRRRRLDRLPRLQPL